MVRCNQYSVPARFIGHWLRVKLSASAVIVYDRTAVVARHWRHSRHRGRSPMAVKNSPK
jgi:hypothetical protein